MGNTHYYTKIFLLVACTIAVAYCGKTFKGSTTVAVGTGASSSSSSSSSSSTTTSSVVYITDTFTRADNAAALGSTETTDSALLRAWGLVIGGAAWGITSNRAYCNDAAANGGAVVDSGQSDLIYVSVDLPVVGGAADAGIIFRYINASNFWTFRWSIADARYYLRKMVAGVLTTVGTDTTTAAPAAADTWRIELSGASITVKKNGTTMFSISDSVNQTGTSHGLAVIDNPVCNSSTVRFDNFKVESL